MSLFTADTHFLGFMDAKDPKPTPELHSHHVTVEGGKRRLMVASLRYLDHV